MKTSINIMKTILLIWLAAFLNSGCDDNLSGQIPYNPPLQTNDGIAVGLMEQVQMDTQKMAECLADIYRNRFDQVHSILVYKDGMLVFEEYMEGNKYEADGMYHYGERIQWHRDSMHIIMSVSKSVASAIIGIAVDKGYIDVSESIFTYLPDHQQYNEGGKGAITVENLLTMTSGLAWDEWSNAHGTTANSIDRIYMECLDDPLACILSAPLVHQPGTHFNYSGGNMIVLSEILQNATGRDFLDFATEYLFAPLGIEEVNWYQFPSGAYACDGALWMTSRSMLKIGITFLNEGTWNGQRIISGEWVKKSQTTYGDNTGINVPIDDTGRNGYGYTWWTNSVSGPGGKVDIFQASGWGGQEIIVIPELDMTVVFTGGNYVVKKHIHKMLEESILASCS